MRTILACLLCALAVHAAADDPDYTSRDILGWVEWVVIEPDGPAVRFKAKFDTGAKTSSLHAARVETFERDERQWVRFDVPLTDHLDVDESELEVEHLTLERPVARTVRIKTHGNDDGEHRYIVELEFCLAGRRHEAEFSLNRRDDFLYPILLGRRFLGGRVVVDAAYSFLAERDCAYTEVTDLDADNAVDPVSEGDDRAD